MTKIYIANYSLDDWRECFDVSDHDFAWPSVQEVVAATTDDPKTDPALRAMIEAVKQIVEAEIAETFDTSYLEPEDQEPMPVVVWTEVWGANDTDRQVVRLFATKKQEAEEGDVATEGEYEGMSDADTFAHPDSLAEIAVVRDALFVAPA